MSFPLMPVVPPDSSTSPTTGWTIVQTGGSETFRKVDTDGNGTWLIAGESGRVYKTTNLGDTVTYKSVGSTNQLYGMSYGAGTFVVGEDRGSYIYSSSDSGNSWIARTGATPRDYRNIAFRDGYFVAGTGADNNGSGYVIQSTDGKTWTGGGDYIVGPNPVWTSVYLAALKRTVALGDQYKYRDGTPIGPWSGSCTGLSGTVKEVAWNGTRAACVGTGGVFYSSDLKAWTKVTAGYTSIAFLGIAWCGNKFVAVGENGIIATSTDGITWTSSPSGVTVSLFGVRSGLGTILITGNQGTILRST